MLVGRDTNNGDEGTIHCFERSQGTLTRLISIYLVGFPASAGRSDIEVKVTLVTDMIQHLTPEARVFAPHGSRTYKALNLPDLSIEDYDGSVADQEGQKPHAKGSTSAIDDQNTDPAPDELPLTEGKNNIGDSLSVINLAVQQFSPEWIEEEAMILLRTIHENARTEGTAHRSKLLLAGYGFGGIVVKQVLVISPIELAS